MAAQRRRFSSVQLFTIPGVVLLSLVGAISVQVFLNQPQLADSLFLLGIAVGSWQLIRDTYRALKEKNFALDYIAILAILTGLLTGNFLVAGVIVLMMSGGNTLEAYAQDRARRSLTSLSNRIPHEVVVIDNHNQHRTVALAEVSIGSLVLVRKGEVVPLDGILESESAVLDQSSLTGEPYPVNKDQGDQLRSGVVNVGDILHLKTTVTDRNSTYHKIVQLVEAAQQEKTPFLQLADALSGWFTLVTLALAGVAYLLSSDLNRVLAVLVIATPCPLILAAPVALIGGMNAAARERIIFKRLAALEILSRVKVMIFDKTGTLTFGVPELTSIESHSEEFSERELLALAAGLEHNSLHPFAKAILEAAAKRHIQATHFVSIAEKIGHGIKGEYRGKTYRLTRDPLNSEQIVLLESRRAIGYFQFTDQLKPASLKVLTYLQRQGLQLHLFTGDTSARAEQLLAYLPAGITVKAECSPEDKRRGIAALKKTGQLTAMVGDGINDAPAVALADVGMVFSHEEHTAASEAADVILLGGTFQGVLKAVLLSRHTLAIAKQSMYLGLGLSLAGMGLAVVGVLPPLAGAISQEIIDVAVILNALRAAVPAKHIK